MDDETKLICLDILETAEKIFDRFRVKEDVRLHPRDVEVDQDISQYIKAVRKKLLAK